jgi:putative DNA primase/helicase
MLLAIQNYIRKYLVCTDYETVLLSLWIVHAWCYRAFRVTPYLNIQSPGPSSGKSRLLHILQALCPPGSWLLSAPSQRILLDKLLSLKPNPDAPKGEPVQDLPSALLLDDCEASLGASSRNALVSLLKIGVYSELRYFSPVKSHFLREFTVFCPKAFAGTGPLPRSLSELSIPIRLKRNKPSETVARFVPATADAQAKPLVDWLKVWSEQNFDHLARSADVVPADLPKQLDGHRLEGAIPPIHIADKIHGSPCKNVRNSFAWIYYHLHVPLPQDPGLELLRDIQTVFQQTQMPAWLTTSEIVRHLNAMEDRPWKQWGRSAPYKLGRSLGPFGIRSRNHRGSSTSVAKGYCQEDFADAWERYKQEQIPVAN